MSAATVAKKVHNLLAVPARVVHINSTKWLDDLPNKALHIIKNPLGEFLKGER